MDTKEYTKVLYDEDVMFLTKPYHDCYEDSEKNNYEHSHLAIDGLVSLIEFMREQFKQLTFDFHSCFYYDSNDKVQ